MSRLGSEELGRRTPVWVALSDLFRDNEFTDLDVQHVARVLRASGYGQPELEHILRNEVAPSFGWNLLSIAGEWAGWSDEVVREAVLDHLSRRRTLRGGADRLAGWVALRMAADDWRRVRNSLG